MVSLSPTRKPPSSKAEQGCEWSFATGSEWSFTEYVSRPVELCEFQTYFANDLAKSRVTLRVAAGIRKVCREDCRSMTALVVEAGRPIDPPADDGFEVSYVSDGGAEHRVPLAQASAVPLEQGMPVRRFTSRKGQRHLSGLWWSATTGGHVGFESWLERDHLLHLDFDQSVVGIASQPFWLHWSDAARKPDSHSPDFFARQSEGSAVVVDCRPVERRKPRDIAKFEATARACALAGWEYRLRNAIMVRRAILGRGLLPLLGRAILGRDSSVQPPRIPTLRHSRPA